MPDNRQNRNEKTFADFVSKGSFVLEKGDLVLRPIPSWLR